MVETKRADSAVTSQPKHSPSVYINRKQMKILIFISHVIPECNGQITFAVHNMFPTVYNVFPTVYNMFISSSLLCLYTTTHTVLHCNDRQQQNLYVPTLQQHTTICTCIRTVTLNTI